MALISIFVLDKNHFIKKIIDMQNFTLVIYKYLTHGNGFLLTSFKDLLFPSLCIRFYKKFINHFY